MSPSQKSANSGDNIIISCTSIGNPKPTINWQRLLGDIPSNARATPDGRLIISSARKDDGGIYQCVGKNSVGKATASVLILIKGRGM